MLTKILLSPTWQLINLKTNYKNNNNVSILVQTTEDDTAPEESTGLIILPFASFKIPADGSYYWVKMSNGAGELVQDPTYIVPNISLGEGSTILESDESSFAGTGSYTEITLTEDPEVAFQAIISPIGTDGSDIGAVTVTYPASNKFRVYNTGLSTGDFSWTALINS